MSDTNAQIAPHQVSSLIGSRTLQRRTKEVLDHVEQVGEPVVILRYGRPAAALVPIDEEQAKSLLLAASVRAHHEAEGAHESDDTPSFAVSEREIGAEGPAVLRAAATMAESNETMTPALLVALLTQTTDAMRKSLAETFRRVRRAAESTTVEADEPTRSALERQERTVLAAADLVEEIRLQGETLSHMVEGEQTRA